MKLRQNETLILGDSLVSSEAEQGREHTTGEVNRVIAEIGKLRKDMLAQPLDASSDAQAASASQVSGFLSS